VESLEFKDPCPKCGHSRLKSWDDLNADQQFLAERLPASAEYTLDQRKKHRFCTRCWYEEPLGRNRTI
jgi:hypothetical protein